MPFCVGCGADVTNKSFCAQCGKPVTGAPSATAVAPQPVSIEPKKTSPIVWILLGVVGFFVLIGFAVMAGLGFLAHKVAQNPALAITKLATAANPDIQVLSTDEGANTVTLRDKRTGETVTMNFDDVKKGKIVFTKISRLDAGPGGVEPVSAPVPAGPVSYAGLGGIWSEAPHRTWSEPPPHEWIWHVKVTHHYPHYRRRGGRYRARIVSDPVGSWLMSALPRF